MSPFDVETDFLVPSGGFLVGMGTVLNLSGRYFPYNNSNTVSEADAKALGADWGVIGNDFRKVLQREDAKED